jgi:hypothetical protein
MIERYGSHLDYCAQPEYQRWRRQWEPPCTDTQWVDSEQEWPREFPPRQQVQERHGTRLAYHLVATLGIGDRRCVDIGCGHNPHPGLWGVDPHNERHRDELWTPEWYVHNWGRWPHAFSCNAIHFCDQSVIAHNIAKVRGVLRPGGTAVIAINRARIEEWSHGRYDPERLLTDLGRTPGMTRMVWSDEPRDAWMDGNVWIWLRQ